MQIYVERVKCQLGRGSLAICISIRLSNARTKRLGFDIGLDIEFYFRRDKGERKKKIKRRGIKKKIIIDPCQLLIFDDNGTVFGDDISSQIIGKNARSSSCSISIIASSCRARRFSPFTYYSLIE